MVIVRTGRGYRETVEEEEHCGDERSRVSRIGPRPESVYVSIKSY